LTFTIHPPQPIVVQSIAMSKHVCLLTSKNAQTLQIFCMLPVTMAWSSSDNNAIRYILLVLLMTSCFYTMAKYRCRPLANYLPWLARMC